MNEGQTGSKRIIWPNLITVLSAAVLMGTVVVGMALATAWAIAGLFGLGQIAEWVLEAIFGLAGVATIIAFIRNASRIEPFFER
jgi:hypothetical protein